MMNLNNIDKKEKTAILFTAGGSRAAFQWGVVKGLKDHYDLIPNKVFGVSGGAINAALISTLDYGFVDETWRNIDESIVYKGNPFWRLLTLKSSLYSLNPLEESLNKLLGEKDYKIPASCVSVSLKSGNIKEFKNSEENFIRGVRASSSIPVVFEPVEIKNELYIDGGVKNYSPISFIVNSELEVENIIIISSKPREKDFEDIDSSPEIWDMILRVFPISREEMFNSDIEIFEKINRLARQANMQGFDLRKMSGEKYKHYDYLYIEPDFNANPLNFERDHLDWMIEKGYQKAKDLSNNSD